LVPRELIAFISSTYVDLQDYRGKIEETLSRIEARFQTMRFFGSKEGEPLGQCLTKLRQCNYYIGIIGHRYGTIPEGADLSYTELEYQEAKKLGINRRIYIADTTVPVQPNQIEPDGVRRRLEAFKQNLKRENTIVSFGSPDDLATKVLSDIFLSHHAKAEIDSFTQTKYLPAIRRSSASISFLGLDIQSMKRHKDVKLESVYVEPRFGTTGEKSDLREPSATVSLKSLLTAEHVSSSESVTAEEILTGADNIVILGDAGVGKSTFTKFLTVTIIDGGLATGGRGGKTIPIKIPLRTYAEFRSRPEGLGSTILDFIRATTKTELQRNDLPDDFFEVFLEQGSAVVIFDGLDEIFDSHFREKVRNDIVSFAFGSYPGNKIIVTSRKVGYEEVSFQQPDFAHFEILPFNTGQVSEYIHKWYALEEADRTKRAKEEADLKSALEKLPEELLGNPLLLSLIVILFRSGCTLPESKLEIYRSCVGTLTEKWDAAGKRLELPADYGLVRDKKSAFAHIGYWMYRRQTQESDKPSRPRYADVLAEFTRYLCEREFQDREGEAEPAAESFLEYAARRSIFIEDKFSHKTFHEYFAALYLYRHFCVGKTVDDLYAEIRPYLGNDSWSVVLELLLLMIDEQGSILLEALLNKVIHEAGSNEEHSYAEILVLLRVLGQLQNIGGKTLNLLLDATANALLSGRVEDLWEKQTMPETTHQKMLTAVEGIPTSYHDLFVGSLRRIGAAPKSEDTLPLLAALLYESVVIFPRFEDLIPGWNEMGETLARRHLSVFYAYSSSQAISVRINSFLRCFGSSNFFKACKKIFRAGVGYRPFAEYSLLSIVLTQEIEAFDAACDDFLASEPLELLLQGLTKRCLNSDSAYNGRVDVIMEHFSKTLADPRKYLLDYLILARLWFYIKAKAPRARRLKKTLRAHAKKSSVVQRFYASLFLGAALPDVSEEELSVSPQVFHELLEIAKRSYGQRRSSGRP